VQFHTGFLTLILRAGEIFRFEAKAVGVSTLLAQWFPKALALTHLAPSKTKRFVNSPVRSHDRTLPIAWNTVRKME